MTGRKIRLEDRAAQTAAARFLRSAQLCRTRDLEQLLILSELVQGISKLVHALQKERGVSSIFIGSSGATFAEHLSACVADSSELEKGVRDRLEHIDEQLQPMRAGARFYLRAMLAFQSLDTLPDTRRQIVALTLPSTDAVKSYSDLIGQLLAVSLETADIAADPATSRAVIALVNFSQAKEYAGQERATAGAALSRGYFDDAERRRLEFLVSAQDRAFRLFEEFAHSQQVMALEHLNTTADSLELQRIRLTTFGRQAVGGQPRRVNANDWYEITTRRIDAMKVIEDALADELGSMCASKLAEAPTQMSALPIHTDGIQAAATVAMLVTDVDPSLNALGIEGGVGFYALDAALPMPMRSFLDVLEAQSRQIDDVSSQLASARTALAERKTIERAKGILMKSRRLTETDAYALMRHTAMSQNKRLIDIAEAIVSMADVLKL
jgi:AmiR/NasT family two-component response regulator